MKIHDACTTTTVRFDQIQPMDLFQCGDRLFIKIHKIERVVDINGNENFSKVEKINQINAITLDGLFSRVSPHEMVTPRPDLILVPVGMVKGVE